MPHWLSLVMLCSHCLVSFQFSPVQPQTEVPRNTAVRALHRSDCSRLCLYLPRQYNSKAALKKHKISNHRSKIGHGSILGGSLKRSAPPEPAEGLGMAKLAKRCNHPHPQGMRLPHPIHESLPGVKQDFFFFHLLFFF
jgi:hypothetical protein